MITRENARRLSLSPIWILLFVSYDCYAYLDPGTGSIIIQSTIAAVAGAAIVIKTYWYRISGFISKLLNCHNDNLETEVEKTITDEPSRFS